MLGKVFMKQCLFIFVTSYTTSICRTLLRLPTLRIRRVVSDLLVLKFCKTCYSKVLQLFLTQLKAVSKHLAQSAVAERSFLLANGKQGILS